MDKLSRWRSEKWSGRKEKRKEYQPRLVISGNNSKEEILAKVAHVTSLTIKPMLVEILFSNVQAHIRRLALGYVAILNKHHVLAPSHRLDSPRWTYPTSNTDAEASFPAKYSIHARFLRVQISYRHKNPPSHHRGKKKKRSWTRYPDKDPKRLFARWFKGFLGWHHLLSVQVC